MFLYSSFLSDKYLATYVLGKIEMNAGLHTLCPLLSPYFNQKLYLEVPNMIFHDNPLSISQLSCEYRWKIFIRGSTGRKRVCQGSWKLKNSVALVRGRTIPTEPPPLVGEVSANFGGHRVTRGQRNLYPRL
jgi:hypothetical protein